MKKPNKPPSIFNVGSGISIVDRIVNCRGYGSAVNVVPNKPSHIIRPNDVATIDAVWNRVSHVCVGVYTSNKPSHVRTPSDVAIIDKAGKGDGYVGVDADEPNKPSNQVSPSDITMIGTTFKRDHICLFQVFHVNCETTSVGIPNDNSLVCDVCDSQWTIHRNTQSSCRITSERAGWINDKVLNNGILQAAKQSCVPVFCTPAVHDKAFDGESIALKRATECDTSTIGETTQWKGENWSRKVKVIKKLNVCFQSASCCLLEQVDQVISSAHRIGVAKKNTEKRKKKEWAKTT